MAAGAVLAVIAATSLAAAEALDLSRLQVFTTGGIDGERSDYQGPTAAGGKVTLRDFDIDGDLTAGGHIRFARGQIRGVTRSTHTRLDRVFSSDTRQIRPGALDRPAAQLAVLAARLSCVPATVAPTITHGTLMGDPVTLIRINATHDLDVADLSAQDLASTGPNRLRLMLNGDAGSHLVVRVHGASADLSHVGFSSQGGLTPRQVVFAFPDARSVTIASAGGAVGTDGTPWGVPGSVVAPNAAMSLAAVTITGQVFAGSIAGLPGLPSGQINRFGHEPSRPTFVSSSVLQRILGDNRLGCDVRT